MSSLFCDRCGTLFDTPKQDEECISCSYCNFKVNISQGILDNVITKSAERKQADWAQEITNTENNIKRFNYFIKFLLTNHLVRINKLKIKFLLYPLTKFSFAFIKGLMSIPM